MSVVGTQSHDAALGLRVRFISRETPLPIEGALAFGASGRAFAVKLLALTDDSLHALRGAIVRDTVIVLGPADSLPWVDGVTYVGREQGEPRLYLPTHSAPDVPFNLFARAVLARAHNLATPLLVFANGIASTAAARSIDRNRLEAWLRKPSHDR